MNEKIDTRSRRRSRQVTKPNIKTKVKRNKTAMFLAIFIALMFLLSSAYVVFNSFNSNNQKKNNTGYPVAEISTSKGLIVVELYNDKAPKTCDNFIKLAKSGFYDGLVFHRVIDNFMIQTGGFLPDGTQKSSSYGNIQFETSDLKHVDGAISMASTGAKVGGSAQFFICDGAQSSLDGNYAVFGKVIEGMDVVREISSVQTTTKFGSYNDWPINDILINNIEILNE
ncbi:MAG: peptidylprolyl isomerase [Candidatus Thermoplasmatota archaeon]|nr:peptidylprolyl isomerase [Candidatus Thermoplasmatota archaeon]